MNNKQKILIVDDVKLNRDILKEILGETYNYLEAENGNQAIQMIGENIGIDLMLLDIQMLNMDGYEATKCIRHLQDIKKAKIPIQVTSGSKNKELDSAMTV